ncbi:MAG TPA: sigma-70 family RNA polymerase sigma factor [Thermoanaerobaculia bacterium]
MIGGVAHLSSIDERNDAENDGALVTAARGGSESAFELLYVRYRRMVHAIALARVPPADAEDVVQDVFVLAMRKLGSLRDGAAFGGWLAAIAKRQASGWRRNVREQSELTDSPVASTQESDEEARHVLATIRTLPVAYRETLLMRLVEGMTGPEIAAQTGLTPDSVRVNLHRGMRLLREALEKNQ